MTATITLSEHLLRDARVFCTVEDRTVDAQIEHWARVGRCAEDNPDLTYRLIKDVLLGVAELDAGESTEYEFG